MAKLSPRRRVAAAAAVVMLAVFGWLIYGGSVWNARSTRPLAWGEQARMDSMLISPAAQHIC